LPAGRGPAGKGESTSSVNLQLEEQFQALGPSGPVGRMFFSSAGKFS
jgi:hypothetical protein